MKASDIKNAFAAYHPVQSIAPISPTPLIAVPAPYADVKASAPVTARLNYTQVGVCPYCNEPTKKTQCCGQTVFLCENDRFVSPLPNSEQE